MCVHTPSPPQRCSSSLPNVVFSSRLAWPGCPPSSPSGFSLEFHLSVRESCSSLQPFPAGLDTQTCRNATVRKKFDSGKLNVRADDIVYSVVLVMESVRKAFSIQFDANNRF